MICLVVAVLLNSGTLSTRVFAQTHHTGTFQFQDVKVTSDTANSNTSGANGTVSIDQVAENPSQQSTFTSRPLPPPPQPPQSILMPQSPTEDTFTNPEINSGVAIDHDQSISDGGRAIGTFANQEAPLPPISRNGLRGNFSTSPIEARQPSDHFSDLRSPASHGSFADQRPTADDHNQPPSKFSFQNESQSDSQSPPPRATHFSSQPSSRLQPSQHSFNAQAVDYSVAETGNENIEYNHAGSPEIMQMDSQVRATSFQQSVQSSELNTELAKQLIDRYSLDQAPNPLPGQPLRLIEMMQQPMISNHRGPMVSQYWETYYDWATMLSRAEYLNWLKTVPNPGSAPDVALLNAAKSAASDQVLAAEIQLGKSQAKLMDFLPSSSAQIGISNLLPLPADQPLIQKYNTNYDLYFSRNMIPQRLRGVDAMLPKTLELICERAETVQLAKSAAENNRNAIANRQSNIAALLEAGRLWRTSEQDLIASVTSYNQAIADYSLAIAGEGHTADQIVSMLIAKPKPVTASNQNQQMANNPGFGNRQFNNSARNQDGFAQPSQPSPLRQPMGAGGQNGFGGPSTNQLGFNAGQNNTSQPTGNFRSPNPPVANSQFSNEGFSNTPPTRSANSQFGPINNQFGR